MTRRIILSRFGIPIAVIAALAVALMVPANAVSVVKKFTETLQVGTGTPSASATLAAGSTQTLTFTITNWTGSNQAYGSAQILVPSGFIAGAPAIVSAPTNFHVAWNAAGTGFLLTSTGPTGSGIPPGGFVSISASVTAPSTGVCNAVWTTEVKQSNDFSGSGNDFVGNSVTTSVGANHLAFTSTLPDTEYDKTMASFQVVAQDPCNQTVSGFTNTITLTDAFSPSKATGTLSVAAKAGVATFDSVTFVNNDWGYDDQFTATTDAAGYASATSNTFSVEQLVTTCAPNKTCGASGLTNPGTVNTLAGISVGSATTTDTLKVSVKGDPNATPPPAFVQACSDSQLGVTGTAPTFYGTIVSLQVNDRQKTVTMTLPKSYVLLQPTPNGTPFWDICLQSDTPFPAKYQTGLVTAGFLPDCPTVLPSPVQPCILSRNKNAGNEIIKFVLPPGDPHAAWG